MRENGLSVSRAGVSTVGEQAYNVFYVRDASGNPVDVKTIEALRKEIKDTIKLNVKKIPTSAKAPEANGWAKTSFFFGNLLERFLAWKLCPYGFNRHIFELYRIMKLVDYVIIVGRPCIIAINMNACKLCCLDIASFFFFYICFKNLTLPTIELWEYGALLNPSIGFAIRLRIWITWKEDICRKQEYKMPQERREKMVPCDQNYSMYNFCGRNHFKQSKDMWWLLK